jgi:hypothetical protein
VTRLQRLQHRFLDLIPADLERGVLYITVEYATAVHSCACGCGGRVVTPFTPTDWQLLFDGETVSLSPSIGNWSFDCQSHYWVRRNRIDWAPQWSAARIARGRELARQATASRVDGAPVPVSTPDPLRPRPLLWLARLALAIRRLAGRSSAGRS